MICCSPERRTLLPAPVGEFTAASPSLDVLGACLHLPARVAAGDCALPVATGLAPGVLVLQSTGSSNTRPDAVGAGSRLEVGDELGGGRRSIRRRARWTKRSPTPPSWRPRKRATSSPPLTRSPAAMLVSRAVLYRTGERRGGWKNVSCVDRGVVPGLAKCRRRRSL